MLIYVFVRPLVVGYTTQCSMDTLELLNSLSIQYCISTSTLSGVYIRCIVISSDSIRATSRLFEGFYLVLYRRDTLAKPPLVMMRSTVT